MKKAITLGEIFREIRIHRSMTMLEVATAAGMDETTVSKVERDLPTRWETVHLALTGMKMKPTDVQYQECHCLWLEARSRKAERLPDGHASKTITKHAVEATRKFRIAIRDLTPEQTRKVVEAAQRAARKVVSQE